LAYGDYVIAAVAANEIVHFASMALFSSLPTDDSGMASRSRSCVPCATPAAGSGGADEEAQSGLASTTFAPSLRTVELPSSKAFMPRFSPQSTSFNALLPFAPLPSFSVSQVRCRSLMLLPMPSLLLIPLLVLDF
jgi:hypothetical protein